MSDIFFFYRLFYSARAYEISAHAQIELQNPAKFTKTCKILRYLLKKILKLILAVAAVYLM